MVYLTELKVALFTAIFHYLLLFTTVHNLHFFTINKTFTRYR